jgi:AraC-like DNA-binding protein
MDSSVPAKLPRGATEKMQQHAESSDRTDLIASMLQELSFEGWFLCLSELSAPWSVALPGGRLAALHFVLEGAGIVHLQDGGPLAKFQAGDLVLVPLDRPHVLSDSAGRSPIAVEDIPGLDRRDRNATFLHFGNGGSRTKIVSASFVTSHPSALPLLAALPPIVKLGATKRSPTLDAALTLATLESGGVPAINTELLRRTLEIVFIATLRAALTDSDVKTGLLGATRDPRLAAVLVAIHANPSKAWTVSELAQIGNMSRTALIERFRNQLGQTPIDYLRNWRLQVALQRLKSGKDRVTTVAIDSGFSSVSAFGRAFRRLHGISPTDCRM